MNKTKISAKSAPSNAFWRESRGLQSMRSEWEMGLAGMAPGPNTSRPHPEHKVYPYLLRDVSVVRPGQVWSTDITYIRLARGFAYLVVIIDWYSRRVLSWRISNSMEAVFCVDCLVEALRTLTATIAKGTIKQPCTDHDFVLIITSLLAPNCCSVYPSH